MADPDRILILGIGNLLWADEGFGVRVVESLNARYVFPEHVELVDGGTQGLYLLRYVQEARRMIVLDAIDYGLEPGTMKIVWNEDVPAFMGVRKMSLHQTGFEEVLACAQLSGRFPEALALIGVQPVELEDYGGSLREPVRAQIEPSIKATLDILRKWNVTAQPRHGELSTVERLNPAGVDMTRYETERPSDEEACRIGDPRILFDRKN